MKRPTDICHQPQPALLSLSKGELVEARATVSACLDKLGMSGPVRNRLGSEAGFTLIEMMVVIVIIGILTTVVVLNVLPDVDKAAITRARADIATLETALTSYKADSMGFPTTQQGLAALKTAPTDLAQPERYRPGGYVQRLPNDPWGKPYQYASPGAHGPFDVWSMGPDGKTGPGNEADDIGNWTL